MFIHQSQLTFRPFIHGNLDMSESYEGGQLNQDHLKHEDIK